MSAPLLWIIFPGFAAVVLYIFRRWKTAIGVAGVSIAFFLAWLAWQVPIGESFSLRLWAGFPAWKLQESLAIFGGRLVLVDTSRPWLTMVYLGVGFWFAGTFATFSDRLFIPTGLGVSALLTASLAIEPGIYAALLIGITALLCVPILSPPGTTDYRGVLRFLVFQTVGICLILLANWSLLVTGTPAAETASLPPAILISSLGFTLILGIFPFHTWIPILAEESRPYAVAFIFYLLPTSILFLLIDYLNYYEVSGIAQAMYPLFRIAGLLTVLAGGIWAAFERHLGRILGFAALLQIGMALLAISLGEAKAGPIAGIYYAQLLPQGIGLAVASLALNVILRQAGSLHFDNIQGQARALPVATASLALAIFSLAGLPLLATFPVNEAIWSALAERSLVAAALSLSGNAALLVAGLRALSVLLTGAENQPWRISERGLPLVLLILGILMLFIIGFLPQLFIPALTDMGLNFSGFSR